MEGNHGGCTALWRGTEKTTWDYGGEPRRLHFPLEGQLRRIHGLMEGNCGGCTALWRGTEENTRDSGGNLLMGLSTGCFTLAGAITENPSSIVLFIFHQN